MKTIGITGGVGAGKSLILNYIREHYKAKIYLADDIANELKLPGHECYDQLVALLGNEVLNDDLTINKAKMAEIIFCNEHLLEEVNRIIHPAVKKYILSEIQTEKSNGKYDLFVLEAALLIEEHYDEILDELWYIFAKKDVRIKRLKESRNYSDEKIKAIMDAQLSEEEFRKHCRVEIDNNVQPEKVFEQVDMNLEELLGGFR